jgi:hypothetical protein
MDDPELKMYKINIGVNLHDIQLGKSILYMTPKGQGTKV